MLYDVKIIIYQSYICLEHPFSHGRPILPKTFHYTSGSIEGLWRQGFNQEILVYVFENLGFCLLLRVQQSSASRDVGSPSRIGELGGQHRLGWKSPVEERHRSRRHRPRERYGELQCVRDTSRGCTRRAPVPAASAQGRQPKYGGKPEEDPTVTCQREQIHHRPT